MKTILITGSAGFIFSNYIRKALYNKSEYSYVGIDACKAPNVLNNIYVNKGHKFYIGDIADKHFVNVIFELEKPDIVLHGAAESFVDDSIKNASNFIHSNILGTQTIIDACLKWNVERLIYTSTDEVYGQLENDSLPAWNESAPLNPRNPYSASKAAGELLIQAAYQTHGLNYNITRSCNNFGPRQQIRNFIPKIIYSILNNVKMPVYGKGQQLREWLYVEDNCNAINTIIEKGLPNEIYNISAGYEFSNLEIFHAVCNIFGRGYDLLNFVEDRPGHDMRYAVNSSKLKDLGWKPNVKFKQGLFQTCNWYEKNSWFLKK